LLSCRFLHAQKKKADSRPGRRRGVSVSDHSNRDVESAKSISMRRHLFGLSFPDRDWPAWPAYRGLELGKEDALSARRPATVTVTLPSGETVSGKPPSGRFTIGMTGERMYHHGGKFDQVHDHARPKFMSSYWESTATTMFTTYWRTFKPCARSERLRNIHHVHKALFFLAHADRTSSGRF